MEHLIIVLIVESAPRFFNPKFKNQLWILERLNTKYIDLTIHSPPKNLLVQKNVKNYKFFFEIKKKKNIVYGSFSKIPTRCKNNFAQF